MSLNKRTKNLLKLTTGTVALAFLLNACGPNQKLGMNDQEAALRATGTLQGNGLEVESKPIIAESKDEWAEPPVTHTPIASVAPIIKVKFVDYEDVGIKVNFDQKMIRVDFDLVLSFLPNQPREKVTLEGQIEESGENKGFAKLSVVPTQDANGKTKAAPPIIGKARCIETCNAVVVDLITKNSNGQFESRQFEVRNNEEDQNAAPTVIEIDSAPAEPSPATTEKSDSSLDVATADTKDAEDTEEHDDAGSDSVPGNAAISDITVDESESLNAMESYVTGQLSNDKQKEVAQELAKQVTVEPRFEVQVYDPKTTKFLKAGALSEFSGKATGFYASYCVDSKGVFYAGMDRCKSRKLKILNGGLADASEFVTKSLGISFANKKYYQQYGSGFLVQYLIEAGKIFSKTFSNESFALNEMSQQFGGPIWSQKNKGSLKHKSHQNGLEVDIPLITKGGSFDLAKTWELIKILNSLNGVQTIYVSQEKIDKICAIAKNKKTASGKTDFEENYEALRTLSHWKGHTTHMHLRLKCTAHNPSCRVERNLSAEKASCPK